MIKLNIKQIVAKKAKVEKVQDLKNDELLFKVKNGLGKLNMRYVKDENDETKVTYFLGDTPLIMANSEYCPTCSVMIQLAEGREKVDKNILEILSNMNSIKNLNDGFEKIKSLLSLLDEGYYILKEVDLIPTDGEGNYFWNLKSQSRYYAASAPYYFSGEGSILGVPKFMLPSQGTNSYNKERVEYYRQRIANGEKLFGVAIELRGFMALLIDGHHKATAAYLEGKTLSCITIINVCSFGDRNNGEEGIYYLDNRIPYNELNNGKEIRAFYNKKNSKGKIKNKDEKLILEPKYTDSINITKPKFEYPDCRAIALSTLPEDTSDKKIEELLNYIGEDSLEELEYIFYNLKIYDKERARELCFKILYKEEFMSLWDICIEFLAQYKDEKIEDVFINFLVEYDKYTCGDYKNIKRIIDEYFG